MKRSKTNTGLVAKAQEIDDLPFPFEQLPTDLIYKIFMDSGFTVDELHKLCNLSKKLKAICNDRKVWEQVLFKNVLEYGTAMRSAERSGDLPELMNDIRRTNALYLVWKTIENYEPFVVLTAIKLWKLWRRRKELWFLHDDDVAENPLIIEDRVRNDEVRISYAPTAESKPDYEKVFAELVNRVGVLHVSSLIEERTNVWSGRRFLIQTARILKNVVSSKQWILFFCFLLTNGWNLRSLMANETERVFDNTPLASCVSCGNASFDQLGRCSCPCEQIFCSVQCQRKLH